MSTALELITGAMRLCGIVAEGEDPSAEGADDALVALNQLLDSWALYGFKCHATQQQAISWASGVASKTIGPSGDFVGSRPVSIYDSSYYVMGGVDYPLFVLNEGEFRSFGGSSDSGLPEYLFCNYTNPNATLYLYPIPSSSITLYLSSIAEITAVSALSDDLSFPPGYLRALRYSLAVEIANEFGVEAPATVQRIARDALNAVRRTNISNSNTNRLALPGFLTRTSSSILEG